MKQAGYQAGRVQSTDGGVSLAANAVPITPMENILCDVFFEVQHDKVVGVINCNGKNDEVVPRRVNLAARLKLLKGPEALLLLGILVAALVLRLWGISFGLPYLYHYDEHFYVNTALNLGVGVLNNPPYAATGLSNILFGEYAGYYVLGRLLGWFADVQQFEAAVRNDPTALYLLGRTTVALMGTATVLVTYLLTRKAAGRMAGLIAGAFLACSFLHVRDSHYAVPDVAMALLVVLAVTLALVGIYEQRKRYVYWASLLGGLAVAMKWTGVMVAFPVFWSAVCVAESKSVIDRILNPTILMGLLFFALGFALGSPQILVNPAPYLQEILGQAGAGKAGGFEIWQVDTLPGWLFYGKTLLWGMGLPLVILGISGLGCRLLLALRGDKASILLLAFPLTYYLLMGATRHYFARYALPLVPFVALFAAEAVTAMVAHIKLKETKLQLGLLLALILAAAAQPLISSFRHDILLTRQDTRTMAKAWIESTVAEGAKIAVDWATHGPPLSTPNRVVPLSNTIYDVTTIGGTGLSDHSLEWYESQGYGYLIATSYIYNIPLVDIESDMSRRDFYASLEQDLVLVQSFWPDATRTEPPFIFDEIYGPSVSLWQRDRPGPVIKIYRLTP